MKKSILVVILLLAAAGIGYGVYAMRGGDSGDNAPTSSSSANGTSQNNSQNQPTAKPAEIKVASNEEFGEYLVDGSGKALYLFVNDSGQPQPCTSSACLNAWPLFSSSTTPVNGEKVNKDFVGSADHPSGSRVVTYKNWPLYYYANDSGPGDTKGEGIQSFGGTWYLVTPAGEAIR